MHVQRPTRNQRRLAIAGVITAAAIAFPSAAFAGGFDAPSSSPSGKSGPPPASSPACADAACKIAAGRADSSAAKPSPGPLPTVPGVSGERLQAGLAAAKQAGGDTPAAVTAFAAAAGVSQTTAKQVVQEVFGPDNGGASGGATSPAAFAAALASKLGVSTSAAQRALDQIVDLGRGGIGPGSPAFAAIARQLGVSPDQLAAALTAAKQGMAAQQAAGK